MSNTPFYTCAGGGWLKWQVVSQTTGMDYSDQLASIQGLTRAASYDGELKTPEITITIAGGGLAGDDVGSVLAITVIDQKAAGVSADLGNYVIKAVDITGKITVIKATGQSGETVPADFNAYWVPAKDPRNFALDWLSQSTSGVIAPPAPVYSDSAHRDYSRVAAPASTLAGLCGFLDSSDHYVIARYRTIGGTYSSWASASSQQPLFDVQWTPAPQLTEKRAFLGRNPLFMHQNGQSWRLTLLAKIRSAEQSGDHCQFPLGYCQYLSVAFTLNGGAVDNPSLYPLNRETVPDATEDLVLEFPTAKEARQYFRDRYRFPSGKGVGRYATHGSFDTGDHTYRRIIGQRKITVTNMGKYEGLTLPFYTSNRSALAPTAPVPTAPATDATEWPRLTLKENSTAITFALNRSLAVLALQYKGAPLTAMWQALGINGVNSLQPVYQLQQYPLRPITINQAYAMRDHFKQACILGSMGFYESSSYGGLAAVDLAPETGFVYQLPLTTSTVVSVSKATSYPMPAKIALTFTDVGNADHTYYYNNSDGQADTELSLGIVQGQIQGWQVRQGVQTANLSSIDWGANPGMLADRFSGSDTSGGTVTLNTISGVGLLSAQLLTSDGQVMQRTGTFPTTPVGTFDYNVRDRDGNTFSLFLTTGSMRFTSAPAASYEDPLLDIFPLLSWLQAHKRVYADNLQRQAYDVVTTFAFVSASPGDVVAVQLPEIFGGAPSLALVLGVTTDTDRVALEIVPMHKITSTDYNNFADLDKVLP